MDATRAISLTWLAHALRAAVARLAVDECHGGRCGITVVSVTATGRLGQDGGDDGSVDPSGMLPALLRALPSGADVVSVASVDELDAVRGARVVVVCVEEEREHTRAEQLRRHMEEEEAAWVVVSFSCSATKGLSLRVTLHPSVDVSATHLEAALRPLEELRGQCGLPLALEMLTKLTAPPPDHSRQQRGASSKAMLASPVASQLPFQLLAMLLRWSFFHPYVVALLGPPFVRKLKLVPQPRIHHEFAALYETHAQLWTELYPQAAPLVTPPTPSALAHHFTIPPEPEADHDSDASLPPLERLSQCALWDKQKHFYREQGIHAWSHHLIPFGVSSSSFLAMQYARLAVDFLRHAFPSSPAPKEAPRSPNCFVWEAASGSCKFLHSFLLHFYELVARERLYERFGIVPCVIASDLSEQVLRSREEMACFQTYVADGRLDFAVFDTDVFLHSQSENERGALFLRHTETTWRVGQESGPVFIIGNYFFDSLRTDVFVVTQHAAAPNGERATEIREARIDATTDNIPDMLFSLAKLESHPRDTPVYTLATANRTLAAVIDRLEQLWGMNPTSMKSPSASTTDTNAGDQVVNSSLILFPIEAIEFLDAVLTHRGELSGNSFPVAVVTGDATFSFRDAVPRSFVGEENGDLEIPQLSPHPDCFCLPVDLEILQLAVACSAHNTSSAIVSTPSSDTFNVFFAQSSQVAESSRQCLSQRFHNIFDQFTPCDCDLLWGLMSVDDGVKHFSSASQLSLLAQTAWDFDVFAAVQWGLMYSWKKRVEELELAEGVARRIELDREREYLAEAGRRSVETMYVLDESTQNAATSLTKLQVARWFYGLRAFDEAERILRSLTLNHPRLQIASIYLSGLVAYNQNDLWTALKHFRKALQLEPKRLRLKKWVARTLIGLQEAKSAGT